LVAALNGGAFLDAFEYPAPDVAGIEVGFPDRVGVQGALAALRFQSQVDQDVQDAIAAQVGQQIVLDVAFQFG